MALSAGYYDSQSSPWRSAPCHRRADVSDFLPAISQGETLVVGKLLDRRRRVQLDRGALDHRLADGAQPLGHSVERSGEKSLLELLFRSVVGDRRRDVWPHGSLPRLRAWHGDGARLLRGLWHPAAAHFRRAIRERHENHLRVGGH